MLFTQRQQILLGNNTVPLGHFAAPFWMDKVGLIRPVFRGNHFVWLEPDHQFTNHAVTLAISCIVPPRQ
ncbi:MAG: hypothetical protein JW953_03585 [Anaerolineae bacterium]|nr:hypothetical protein [Anaerolineae bacterium]